jgi:hypothetical protein
VLSHVADHLAFDLVELRLEGCHDRLDARVQTLGRDLQLCSRCRSLSSMASSCRLRVTSAASHCCCGSANGRRKRARSSRRSSTAANSASMRASTVSVLARRPIDLAKSRAWRGLTTTTARPAACSAQANSVS